MPDSSPLKHRSSTLEYHVVLLLLGSLCILDCQAGPGPAPITSGSGKWWPEWQDEQDTSLAAAELNISAAEGRTASLPCRVLHLHDKTISWIRVQDLTVLAVDRITVTTDDRFSVKHPEETGDWILEIRGALASDSGTYDCQVNTYPKMSTRVHLRVLTQKDADVFLEIPASDSIVPSQPSVVPLPDHYHSRAEASTARARAPHQAVSLHVHGRPWVEVRESKALGLTCEAMGQNLRAAHASSRPPDSPMIEWTLDEVPVMMLFDKDKVEVYEQWQGKSVTSQLTVYELTVADSGTYACHAPHAVTQSVPVTVLHPGIKISYDEDSKKLARKVFREQKTALLLDSHGGLHQMDAAPKEAPKPALLGPPAGVQASPRSPTFPRAASCSSDRTVVISGAVMLAILIVNCVVGVIMYRKSQ